VHIVNAHKSLLTIFKKTILHVRVNNNVPFAYVKTINWRIGIYQLNIFARLPRELYDKS